jgi:hypothetical protein
MASKLNSNSFDIKKALREEGVYAYGFGHIAKAVMFDRDLSCTAKGIYAYFCSYTNKNNTAYPKLTTILKDLGIDKKTYYKHFDQLVENGYITIKKAEGYKNKNVYIINEYVKKININLTEDDGSDSIFVVDGIKAHGFGTVPKLLMIDKRLTIKAKALMAFLLSLSGGGKCAFPRRDVICMRLGITLNTYKSLMKEIVTCGYIIVKQRRNKKGSFAINDYHFVINPVEKDEQKAVDVENSIDVNNYVENCGKAENSVDKENKADTKPNAKNGLNSELSPWAKNSPFLENGLNSELSPRAKNSPLLESDRGPKIPPSPRVKNSPHNNINNNNNTSMIGTSILYPINKVTDNKPIGEELKITLHCISHYDEYSNYSDSYAKKYCKAVDILINLFGESHVSHKGQRIDTFDLWKYFVKVLKEGYSTDTSCVDFMFDVLIYFNNCLSMYHIEHPARYLRTLFIDKIICDYDETVF